MKLSEIVAAGVFALGTLIPRPTDDPSLIFHGVVENYNITIFSSRDYVDMQMHAVNSRIRPYRVNSSFALPKNEDKLRPVYINVQEKKMGLECDASGLKTKKPCSDEVIDRTHSTIKSMNAYIDRLFKHNLYKRTLNPKKITKS